MADSFTQKLLERTRARGEYLKGKTGSNSSGQLTTASATEATGRSPLKEAPAQQDAKNFNHLSPKKLLTSTTELTSEKENGQVTFGEERKPPAEVRIKSKLKELSSLYGSEDGAPEYPSSYCAPQNSAVASPNSVQENEQSLQSKDPSRRTRLAALANRINDWQDESDISPLKSQLVSSTPVKESARTGSQLNSKISGSSSPVKSKVVSVLNYQSPTKTAGGIVGRGTNMSPIKNMETSVKRETPTKSVEAQGYTPSSSRRSRVVYEFEKERKAKIISDSEESDAEDSRGQDESAKSWSYVPPTPKTSNTNLNAARSSPVKAAEQRNFPRSPQKNVPMSSPQKTVPQQLSPKKTPQQTVVHNSASSSMSVAQRAAMFESSTPVQPKRDPAELSLTERKALFEKNKGRPPMPVAKTPVVAGKPTPQSTPARPVSTPVSRSEVQSRFLHQALAAEQNASSAKAERMKELDMLRKRYDQQKKLSYAEDESEDKETDAMMSFAPAETTQQTSSAIPMAPPLPSVVGVSPKKNATSPQKNKNSPTKYAGVDDCKKIRVSPPKPGMLYPCLSDIEMTTETEADCSTSSNNSAPSQASDNVLDTSQDLDSSFTVDILGRAGLSQFINTPKKRLLEMNKPTPKAQQSGNLRSIAERADSDDDSDQMGGDISELLDEALEDDDSANEPTPPKQSRTTRLPETVMEGGREVPLFHSVSFYRKQKQQEYGATPVKQIIRKPEVVAPSTSTHNEEESRQVSQQVPVHQQIRALQEEINAQQTVISQASQALNLCRATAEFSGSTEQVEGERLLLVATQKRQAAINEIQRLKNEAALNKNSAESKDLTAKGTLSISNLALPLKKEFLSMLAKGGDDFVHYFLILVRSRGQVVPTQMLSSLDGIQDGALRFPNLIQLRDLHADFNVAVEVYALQTRREKLAHDAKYHIRKESSKMRLTPKKLLNKQESRLLSTPSVQSPGGPLAVRSSSFGLVGFSSITPASVRRKQWGLEKVPFASPLTGDLNIRIQCHTESLVEERGFLTMFEDVSGFGAWHRRWCVLSNDRLSIWKYPDDERRKEPMGHISLKSCVTEMASQVSRDICARPNTFLLVTVRPRKPEDKDSLVMTCYPHRTALRHLISADSKEERILWCTQINKALANLRAWDPNAQEPSSDGAVPKIMG